MDRISFADILGEKKNKKDGLAVYAIGPPSCPNNGEEMEIGLILLLFF